MKQVKQVNRALPKGGSKPAGTGGGKPGLPALPPRLNPGHTDITQLTPAPLPTNPSKIPQ